MSLEDGICSLCNKPVLDGQARNGCTGDHWDCYENLIKQVEEDGKRIPELAKVAKKLVKMFRSPI